ncbi:hypothetical protein BA190_09325 [Labrys sp. WJW]|uniref:hypothetical protein n=1 Tax=Labrys sp. WJW TaxID=1737983 RepID=UPI00082BD950|nr:hypothetical protein [Labrys sp. WJW]OCC05106.1 hypothetical protein BA190_09325 [Labrys sp. WJW]
MSLAAGVNDLASRIAAEIKAIVGRVSPAAIVAVFDGGGSVIPAGTKVTIPVPVAGTAKDWTLLADVSGDAVVNIYKCTFAAAPPTVADKITASAPPTLAAAAKATSTALTGWTTAVASGDVFTFIVDSNTAATKLSIALKVQR